MKNWYDESLKALDSQIVWPEKRRREVKVRIFAQTNKQRMNKRIKEPMIYISSIVTLSLIMIIGTHFAQYPKETSFIGTTASQSTAPVIKKEDVVQSINGVPNVNLTPEGTISINLSGRVTGIKGLGSYSITKGSQPYVYLFYPFEEEGGIHLHSTKNETGEINIIEKNTIGKEKMWIKDHYAELNPYAPQVIIYTKNYIYYISGDNVSKEQVIQVAEQIKINDQ